MVDALDKDAKAALAALEGELLSGAVAEGVGLLATVAGQDVEQKEDSTFVIAKQMANDRTISTVDTEARHGDKSHDALRQHPVPRPRQPRPHPKGPKSPINRGERRGGWRERRGTAAKQSLKAPVAQGRHGGLSERRFLQRAATR
jgi:hypothetical protein